MEEDSDQGAHLVRISGKGRSQFSDPRQVNSRRSWVAYAATLTDDLATPSPRERRVNMLRPIIKGTGTGLRGFLLIASCLLVFVSIGVAQPPRSSKESPLDVSLIQLIARPDDFDGEYVRVLGFYRHEFEGNALYLHREDYEHGLSKNAFWLDGKPEYDKRYVLVQGRFNATRLGHLGAFSGTIENLTRIQRWP